MRTAGYHADVRLGPEKGPYTIVLCFSVEERACRVFSIPPRVEISFASAPATDEASDGIFGRYRRTAPLFHNNRHHS